MNVRVLLCVLGSLALLIASIAEAEEVDRQWISHQLEVFRQAHQVPGLACAIVVDGEPAFVGATGLAAPNRPLQEDPIFYLASVSKQMTAAAVLLLVEDGSLSLDTTLSDLEFRVPNAEAITIYHLLTHTSGIPDYITLSHPFAAHAPVSGLQLLGSVQSAHRVWPRPGQGWQYSNSNYRILADVVAQVSDQSFETFMEERLFGPLGMRDTRIGPPKPENHTRLTQGHFLARPISYHHSWFVGAAAVSSTVRDLVRWNRAMREGELLSEESLDQMHSPAQLEAGRLARVGDYPVPLGEDFGILRYGMGSILAETPRTALQMHTGWNPHTGYIAINAAVSRGDRRVEVIMLGNSGHPLANQGLGPFAMQLALTVADQR